MSIDRAIGFNHHVVVALALVCVCSQGCVDSADSEPASKVSSGAPSVEVMHWLTAGTDAAALAVIRDGLITRGGVWRDTPMPGAGTTGRAAAVNRIVGGQPPDVFQFSLGAELLELAAQNLVAPVPTTDEGWHAALPVAVDRVSRYQQKPIAIPMAIRGENWLFYNKAVLHDANVEVPRTWPEFLAAASRLKARGLTPIALGGQPWQERLLFNVVLLGVGGRDLYRQVYERAEPGALDSTALLQVFETFGTLRSYVDEASPGRRWSHTTLMLVHGQAAFQFMGDWAKAEITAAGLTPGQEIGCVLAPAREDAYVMMIDAFVFGRTSDPAVQAGQRLFAETLQDRRIQTAFALAQGTLPARLDVTDAAFDSCSLQALQVIRDPQAQLLDPALSLSAGLAGSIDDTISHFWNDKSMTAKQGQALFRKTLLAHR